MTTVRVAVCTNRAVRPELLADVLGQAPDALVVAAGLNGEERDVLARCVRECSDAADVLKAEGPGLARARNAALAACEADVLVLVDDDVRPPAGWLAAVVGAWDSGGEDLAALGGPIRLSFPAGRPAWLGAALDPALGAFTLECDAHDVDPARRTLPGANLSLRAEAARGAGGFWPARGHRHGRDWFSEEHALQRTLAASGWRVRYDPALEVVREPRAGPAAIVSARLRYGARSRMLGGRGEALPAAVQALASAGGTALAAARGDRARALERAARAAENIGVLLGEGLAHREMQPTGPTPFRASVPPPAPPGATRLVRRVRAGARRGPRAVILAYHRVARPRTDALALSISPENFAEQVEVLSSCGAVVSLAELGRALSDSAVPDGAVVLTFDDGYADNLSAAAPALTAARLPATVFAVTGHVASPAPFWWDEAEELLLGPGMRPASLVLELDGERRGWRTATQAERVAARRHLHLWLQPLPLARIAVLLDQLRAWAGGAAVKPAVLDLEALRSLAGHPGISIGAHTRRHPSLGRSPEAEQREEIAGSGDDLARWLGAAPGAFSYPFGVPGQDVTDTTRRLVAEAGFDHAVLNAPGAVTAATDRFALPRHIVPDLGADAFATWLRERRGR